MLSDIESAVFNCKVGRAETNVLDAFNFEQSLIKQSIDFCRLKLDSSNLKNYRAIAQLNMPHQFCGSILKYKMDFFNLPKPFYKNKDLIFEVYNPSTQKNILRNLVEHTFINDPIGYYKNHLLSKILTKQQEVECMSKWYVKHCDDSKNKMVLMKSEDEYIGYISIFKTAEDIVNTPIAGVLPKFQGQKMFDDLRTYRHLYCLENKIQYGTAGARIENNYSQQTFIKDGMQQIGNEAIYIVTPFLGEKNNIIEGEINYILADYEIFDRTKDFLLDFKHLMSYSKTCLSVKKEAVVKYVISLPVNTDQKKILVVRYFNVSDELCLVNWLEC